MIQAVILSIIRLWDKTAFICLECGKIKRGFGERILIGREADGWLCSRECSDAFWDRRHG
jgi:hypothetical protein